MKKASRPSGPAGDSIDWPAIHERLGRAAAALQEHRGFSPGEKKRILKERAKALAREPEPVPAGEALELVEFALAYERYAIESAWVREIHPLREITPLPGTPSFLAGIINLHGRIVSVVDLKKFFDLPPRGLTDLNKVILVSDEQMEFGLLVDAVPGLCRVACAAIQPGLPTLSGPRADYLRGVTGDRLVILDMARLLADPNLKICQNTDT
jgi:purine-binding chemotaxis protein CheW